MTAVNNTIEGFVGNVESSVKKFLAPAAAWGDLVDNLINVELLLAFVFLEVGGLIFKFV